MGLTQPTKNVFDVENSKQLNSGRVAYVFKS